MLRVALALHKCFFLWCFFSCGITRGTYSSFQLSFHAYLLALILGIGLFTRPGWCSTLQALEWDPAQREPVTCSALAVSRGLLFISTHSEHTARDGHGRVLHMGQSGMQLQTPRETWIESRCLATPHIESARLPKKLPICRQTLTCGSIAPFHSYLGKQEAQRFRISLLYRFGGQVRRPESTSRETEIAARIPDGIETYPGRISI